MLVVIFYYHLIVRYIVAFELVDPDNFSIHGCLLITGYVGELRFCQRGYRATYLKMLVLLDI